MLSSENDVMHAKLLVLCGGILVLQPVDSDSLLCKLGKWLTQAVRQAIKLLTYNRR